MSFKVSLTNFKLYQMAFNKSIGGGIEWPVPVDDGEFVLEQSVVLPMVAIWNIWRFDAVRNQNRSLKETDFIPEVLL